MLRLLCSFIYNYFFPTIVDHLVKCPSTESTTLQSAELERPTFRIVPIREELLPRQKQKRRQRELELKKNEITNLEPIKIHPPTLLLPGKTVPQYKYNVLVIPKKISEFKQNTEEIIFKPQSVQEKYSDVSLSRKPEIQFDNDRDRRDRERFEKASLHASQRTDSLGSGIEKQQNPTSYSYDYAVNDGPAGPVISKAEQSDGVLTRVRPRRKSL